MDISIIIREKLSSHFKIDIMKTRETITIKENDYCNVIIVIGIAVMMNILFSSLGLDITDTAKHMASNIAMVF